jgi:hypothetical protein
MRPFDAGASFAAARGFAAGVFSPPSIQGRKGKPFAPPAAGY